MFGQMEWADGIYLDQKKAFNKVPYKTLLWKLERTGGIQGKLMELEFDLGRGRRGPHPGFHPSLVDKWVPRQPREGKLWKAGFHAGPMSRVRDYSTTGSKAKETGDEHPQLCADSA